MICFGIDVLDPCFLLVSCHAYPCHEINLCMSIGLALSSACLDAMFLVVLRVHSKYSPGLARGQITGEDLSC